MKFVSKFKFGLPVMANPCSSSHGILLGLLSPFLMDEVEALIILGLVSLS
jgi:hypothetical protein